MKGMIRQIAQVAKLRRDEPHTIVAHIKVVEGGHKSNLHRQGSDAHVRKIESCELDRDGLIQPLFQSWQR